MPAADGEEGLVLLDGVTKKRQLEGVSRWAEGAALVVLLVTPARRMHVGAARNADAVGKLNVLVHELLGLHKVVGEVHHEGKATRGKDGVNVALGGGLVGAQLLVTVDATRLEARGDQDERARSAAGHEATFPLTRLVMS